MIRFPTTIYVATAPIDLRLSFDRLAGIVRDQLGADPRGEALYVFHNQRPANVPRCGGIVVRDPRGGSAVACASEHGA